jgi:threonine dehydrogenase-like Zn-dependent dehydrogenase
MKQKFNALDYTSEDKFISSEYLFEGDEKEGWKIFRNGEFYLELSKGYKLLKTKACGVCSTDLDRRFLPFPLPQVIGHELIALDPIDNQKYAVEINDTLLARGSEVLDAFCLNGLPTHSPSRMVLGIDRLPGGFGPYILAPIHAMVPIESLQENTAVLIEPFAAALQAVISSPPPEHSEVAVLGPRRLGSLIIGALSIYRKHTNRKFKITALARHDKLLELSKNLGADEAIDIRNQGKFLQKKFDIVYDTTASPEGFENALFYSKEEVHLKSTNGQAVCGIKKMTEMVVDEISILPFTKNNLDFHWEKEPRINKYIYLSPSLKNKIKLDSKYQIFSGSQILEIENYLKNETIHGGIPRFDIAIVSSTEEIDFVLRPSPMSEESILRPRGAILFYGDTNQNPLLEFIHSGGCIRSSRCGDFSMAIQLLKENEELAKNISKYMISHEFLHTQLESAFETAKDKNSIKVIIKYDET